MKLLPFLFLLAFAFLPMLYGSPTVIGIANISVNATTFIISINSTEPANVTLSIRTYSYVNDEISDGWDKALDWNSAANYAKGLAADVEGNIYAAGWVAAEGAYETPGITGWLKRFYPNGTEDPAWNLTFVNFFINEVALDRDGDAYLVGEGYNVTGSGSRYDWRIIKLNSSGQEQISGWNKTFDGYGYNDYIFSAAVDSENSIYVGGQKSTVDTNWDWWIKKFSSDGTEDTSGWDKTYDDSTFEWLYSIVVDSEDNIYAGGTGYDLAGDTAYDWIIKRFDPSGAEDTASWDKVIDGITDTDKLYTLHLDGDDNVYAGGYGSGVYLRSSNDPNAWIFKFSPDGTAAWNTSFRYEEVVNDIAIRPGHNLFAAADTTFMSGIAGESWTLDRLVQISSGGASRTLVDRFGDIYLMGSANNLVSGSSNSDVWIRKFSGWDRTSEENSSIQPSHNITLQGLRVNTTYYYIATLSNSSGGIYATQEYNFTTPYSDVFAPTWSSNSSYPLNGSVYEPGQVFQFNVTWSDRNLSGVWIEHDFNGTLLNHSVSLNVSGSLFIYAYSNLSAGSYVWRMHAIDASGNVNTTPYFAYELRKANITAVFTLNGVEASGWNKSLDGNRGDDRASSISIDGNSDIFIAGYGTNIVDEGSDQDWWIKKYASNGTEYPGWDKRFDASSSYDRPSAVLADDDAVYVAGFGRNMAGPSTNMDIWIKRFYLNGSEDPAWNISFGGAGNDIINDLASDSQYVYAAGKGFNRVSPSSSDDIWIMRFSRNGSISLNVTGHISGSESANSISVDENGNIIAVGEWAASTPKWTVKKYSPSGAEDFNWNKTHTAYSSATSVARDESSGAIFCAGYLQAGTTEKDWWIRKFSSSGTEDVTAWNKVIDGKRGTDTILSIALYGNESVYLAGYGTSLRNSTSQTDSWIKRYSSDGTEDISWNKTYDWNGKYDMAYDIAVDPDGYVYSAGYGTNLVSSASGNDWWIKKFYPNGTEFPSEPVKIQPEEFVEIDASISDADTNISLYANGTLIAEGRNISFDLQFNTTGDYNISIIYASSANYNPYAKTLWLRVEDDFPFLRSGPNVSSTTTTMSFDIAASENVNCSAAVGGYEPVASANFSDYCSLSAGGLVPDTLYQYNFTICDKAGQCTSETGEYSTASASPNGNPSRKRGSPAGGGGSFPVSIRTEGFSWKRLEAGNHSLNLSEYYPLSRMVLGLGRAADNASLRIAKVLQLPPGISEVNRAYAYFVFNSTLAGSIKAQITFGVDENWTRANPGRIVMSRHNGSGWHELPTEQIDAETYEAISEGFSYFAIHSIAADSAITDHAALEAEFEKPIEKEEQLPPETSASEKPEDPWPLALAAALAGLTTFVAALAIRHRYAPLDRLREYARKALQSGQDMDSIKSQMTGKGWPRQIAEKVIDEESAKIKRKI